MDVQEDNTSFFGPGEEEISRYESLAGSRGCLNGILTTLAVLAAAFAVLKLAGL